MGPDDEHLAARVGPVAGPGRMGGSGGINQQLGQAACWLGPLHRPEHCQGELLIEQEQEQEQDLLPARKTLRFLKACVVRVLYVLSTAAVENLFLRTVLVLSTRSVILKTAYKSAISHQLATPKTDGGRREAFGAGVLVCWCAGVLVYCVLRACACWYVAGVLLLIVSYDKCSTFNEGGRCSARWWHSV